MKARLREAVERRRQPAPAVVELLDADQGGCLGDDDTPTVERRFDLPPANAFVVVEPGHCRACGQFVKPKESHLAPGPEGTIVRACPPTDE